jgi:TPR repeat protein
LLIALSIGGFHRVAVADSGEKTRAKAKKGDARAQSALGEMSILGQGVPQDYAKAATGYRKAAAQELAEAQYYLGFTYANGQGVPQDYVQAHMWFNLAASRHSAGPDYDQAVKDRDKVAAKMTPAQIAEAPKLTREWQPTAPIP